MNSKLTRKKNVRDVDDRILMSQSLDVDDPKKARLDNKQERTEGNEPGNFMTSQAKPTSRPDFWDWTHETFPGPVESERCFHETWCQVDKTPCPAMHADSFKDQAKGYAR